MENYESKHYARFERSIHIAATSDQKASKNGGNRPSRYPGFYFQPHNG